MKRNLMVALMLGLVGAAGCSRDFLTTVPQDRISDEIFWKTDNDFTYAVNAAYIPVDFSQGISGTVPTELWSDGATDLAYSQQYWAAEAEWARGASLSTNGYTNTWWNNYYTGITRANDILAHVANAPTTVTATVKDQAEGQAKFLRGYYYGQLLWMFGDVPLITKVLSIDEGMKATRTPRDQVYAQVMKDLTEAAAKLPDSWASSNKGRATKGAALAYKARFALYEASYQKYALNNTTKATDMFTTAADAAQQVISGGKYTLYSNFRNMFTYAGEGNAEVIFDYPRVKGSNGASYWRGFAPVSMGGTAEGTGPSRALVDKFYLTDGKLPSQSPLYNADPVKMYLNRDPRFYATLLYPGATFNNKTYNSFPDCASAAAGTCSTTSDKLDPGNFYNTHLGYMWLKYVDPADQSDINNSGINTILMRYADVLLMFAEAKIELGQLDAAVAPISQVRARVSMPAVTAGTQQQMIDLIRNERAVELAGEGLRMADIRRWRIAKSVMPGTVYGISYFDKSGALQTAKGADTRTFTDAYYLFPIPQTERDLNPDLVQNPGF